MKIAFLIRSLGVGGAERQMVNLAIQLKNRGHKIIVGVLYSGGFFETELRENGINIFSFKKKNRWDTVGVIHSLFKWLIKEKPDVLHSYMVSANIYSVLARFVSTQIKIVWGIRASNMDLSQYGLFARLAYKLEILLSRFADIIITNSYAGKSHMLNNGFAPKKIIVVPNGIDTDKFKKINTNSALKLELGYDYKKILVGIIARIDPMKGHITFIKAVNIFINNYNYDVQFVCVGDGDSNYLNTLKNYALELNVHKYITWLGERKDVCNLYNSFDVVTSSSYGEGFSNSIAEAMSCEALCVATDVGDSKIIIGDAGIIVPPKDPEALANAWKKLLDMQDIQLLRQNARRRIVENFSLEKLAVRTEAAFLKCRK